MLIKLKNKEKNGEKKLKKELIGFSKSLKISFLKNTAVAKSPIKGETASLAARIEALPFVEYCILDKEEYCPEIFSIKAGKTKKDFMIIAGPCAIENEKSYTKTADFLFSLGISHLRAPVFKPRKSVYSFQGLQETAIPIMEKIKKGREIKLVTELMSAQDIEKFSPLIDIIQIGARNMRNYHLLKAAAKTKKTILLKRAAGANLKDWLLSAEYIAKENKNILLCERGDLDLSYSDGGINLNLAMKAKKETNLPVIVDISHSSANSESAQKMALATLFCELDGIMAEIHKNPQKAVVDGAHAINFSEFSRLLKKIKNLKKCV